MGSMAKMNRNDPSTNEEGYIDLSRVFYRVIKGIKCLKFWLILFLVLCTTFYTFFSYQRYIPLYQTKVTFSVIKKNDSVGDYNVDAAGQMQETFRQVLQSQLLQTIVLEDLHLSNLPGYYSCQTVKDTNLLIVSALSTDNQASYDMMLSLMRNYDQVSDLVMSDVKLNAISQPKVPENPCNPLALEGLLLKGAAIGCIVDGLLLTLYTILRHTIIKEEDIREMLNTRCLASIPIIPQKRRTAKKRASILLDQGQNGSQFHESIRLFRHKIESDARRHQNQVYVFSSTIPGEGKTTTSSNLAISLAKNGKTVLLIDADLRKPTLMTMFEQQPVKTLNDVLQKRCTVTEALLEVRDHLVLLGNNTASATPSEDLASDDFKNLVNEMRQCFDFILIDTPPSGEMGDASIVSEYADASIMVIKQDTVPTRRVLEAMEMFVYNSHNLLGCVLNYCDRYQRHGYGYGTYEKKES